MVTSRDIGRAIRSRRRRRRRRLARRPANGAAPCGARWPVAVARSPRRSASADDAGGVVASQAPGLRPRRDRAPNQPARVRPAPPLPPRRRPPAPTLTLTAPHRNATHRNASRQRNATRRAGQRCWPLPAAVAPRPSPPGLGVAALAAAAAGCRRRWSPLLTAGSRPPRRLRLHTLRQPLHRGRRRRGRSRTRTPAGDPRRRPSSADNQPSAREPLEPLEPRGSSPSRPAARV